MPLLNKAPYQFKATPQDLSEADEVFYIPTSGEAFRTYDDYIAKVTLYAREVWTCSLTGKSNLTLAEAVKSETLARKRLKKFPLILEKPTLLLAHHSQRNLDWMAAQITERYKVECVVGEEVQFEGRDAVITSCVTSLEEEEETADRYSYSLKLLETEEVHNDIPQSQISRSFMVPSKELIKMFIKFHTTKSSNMYNVSKEMLLKYSIPHKFATVKSVLTAASAKKPGPKMMNTGAGKASKKSKSLTPTSTKSSGAGAGGGGGGGGGGTTPKMKKVKIHSVGEDGRLVTTWKEVPDKSTPTGNSDVVTISDSDSNSAKSGSEKKKIDLKKSSTKELREFTNKVKSLVKKYKEQIVEKGQGENSSKMKQTSLLTFTNKNTISTTIRDLLGVEENGYRRSLIINELAKSTTDGVLQSLALSTPVKSLLLEKREKLMEKEKLSKMSLAEKETYLRIKEENRIMELQRRREAKLREREEERERQRQERLIQIALERIIVDDLTIEDSRALPPYIPVELPEEVKEPASFQKLALISEAVHCYRQLFVTNDDDTSYTGELITQAVVEGARGHEVLSALMINILQTLVQEKREKLRIPDLAIPLSTVDLSQFNVGASVLVYLESIVETRSDDTMLPELIAALRSEEFFNISADHKLHALGLLCEEVCSSGTFGTMVQENTEKIHRLRRDLQTEAILRNKQRISDKQQRSVSDMLKNRHTGSVERNEESSSKEDEEEDEEKNDEGIGSEGEEESRLAEVVKKRREDIKRKKEEEEKMKAAQEAERIKEQKFREQQQQIQNQRRKEEQLRVELDTAIHNFRTEPLGMDRNYCRYWIFRGYPGFYIEQGWWGEGGYFRNLAKDSLNTSNGSEGSEDSGVEVQSLVLPKAQPIAWYCVPTVEHFESLKGALNKKGAREKMLALNLHAHDERIRAAIRRSSVPSRTVRLFGSEDITVKQLKKDIELMETNLSYAGLGGCTNFNKYMKSTLPTVEQCSEAMLAVQESVEAKYMKKPMQSYYNSHDLSYRYSEKVEVWREKVAAAKTYSELHLLYSVFDNAVKWERSIENIKCKNCKKKGAEKKLLICDVCDTGYHCGCLRPPLKKVPVDGWLCPTCAPVIEAQRQAEESSESEEASDNEEEEVDGEERGNEGASNDDYCCVCEEVGELILCDKCPSAYHLFCHHPPLKRIPRGNWECSKCLKDGEEVEEEKEKEQEEEEEEEEKEQKKGKKRSSSTTNRKSGKKRKIEKSRKRTRVEEIVSAGESAVDNSSSGDDSDRRSSRRSGSSRHRNGSANTREERTNRRNAKRGAADRELEQCEEIINELQKIPESADFIDLVEKRKVPDYYELIENPLSLSMVKQKALFCQYTTATEFVEDVFLLLDNCFSYNLEDSEVYDNGKVLEQAFLALLKQKLPSLHRSFSRSRRRHS